MPSDRAAAEIEPVERIASRSAILPGPMRSPLARSIRMERRVAAMVVRSHKIFGEVTPKPSMWSSDNSRRKRQQRRAQARPRLLVPRKPEAQPRRLLGKASYENAGATEMVEQRFCCRRLHQAEQ